MSDIPYDIETYPNIFTCAFEEAEGEGKWIFEISDRIHEGIALMTFLNHLKQHKFRMVGFNNIGFDYIVLHELIKAGGNIDAYTLYLKCCAIINSNDDTKFGLMIWEDQRYIEQLDLYKIHHFDNRAKSTSLKMLEFNMRLPMIKDLPFKPGTLLTHPQMDELRDYNLNYDVNATKRFYHYTLDAIKFREKLSIKHGKNFLNHNDTKIGKDIMIMQLEAAGIRCFDEWNKPVQTIRTHIVLNDAIFDHINFISPEFQRVKEYLQTQVITETKGVFKDLTATVNGFTFVFGLGGLHGSLKNTIAKADDEYAIIDLDVEGYYPSLGIANKLSPLHLTERFSDIHADIKRQRATYKKGTPENAMLKLAGNGVYGDSNSVYSPFYDPLYTMSITLNGQLLLCALAEQLMQIKHLTLIQANTDGVTVKIRRDQIKYLDAVCKWWEDYTKLTLERNDYSAMYIRDVNNYLAVDDKGAVCKRKGAYAHIFNPPNINIGKGELAWNMNHGARVIAQTAEYCLTNGMLTAEEIVTSSPDLYDFCLRTKVPRSSKLVLTDSQGNDTPLQNICRYYISKGGGNLTKIMPALKGSPLAYDRRIRVEVGWTVTPCNDINDGTAPIDYDYYIQKVNELVLPLKEI